MFPACSPRTAQEPISCLIRPLTSSKALRVFPCEPAQNLLGTNACGRDDPHHFFPTPPKEPCSYRTEPPPHPVKQKCAHYHARFPQTDVLWRYLEYTGEPPLLIHGGSLYLPELAHRSPQNQKYLSIADWDGNGNNQSSCHR